MLSDITNRRGGRLRRPFLGWWMAAIGATTNAIAAGLFGRGFSLYFLPLSRDLGLSRTATSLIFGFSALEGGLQGPITGYMIDRWGPRVLMIAGSVLAGVGFLLLPLTNSFLTFLLVFVGIISVGMHSGFHSGASAIVNNWFIRFRGTAFGIISVGIAIGGTVIVPIVSLMLQNWGWRTSATVSGIVVLAVGVPLSYLVRDTPEKIGQVPDGFQVPGTRQTEQSVAELDYSVRRAMSTVAYWGLAIAICLRLSASAGVMVHIVPIMVWKGMDEATGGIVIAAMSFSGIVTRLGMGWLGDRWQKNKLVSLAMMAGAACLIFLAFSPNYLWLMILFAVNFSVTDGAAGLTWAMIGDYFGRTSFATLKGVIITVVSIGTLATPVIAGRVFDSTQSYQWVLIPFAGLYVVTAVAFLVLRRPNDSSLHEVFVDSVQEQV